jgi:hypothetical protein
MFRSLTFNFRRLFSTEKGADIIGPAAAAADSNFHAVSNSAITPVYTGNSIRTGALGIKKGMMSYWDTWGKRHPVTIIHVRKLN